MHHRFPKPDLCSDAFRATFISLIGFVSTLLSQAFHRLRPGAATRCSFLRWPLLLLPLLLAAGCEQANRSNAIEWVPSSASPTPAMRFELRFQEIMVPADKLGVASDSPLLISPALPGTFTWISPRSGVFTPTQALALDTHYRVTLRPGLRRADGRRSRAGLRWTIKTPPLSLIGTTPGPELNNASNIPEISLAFNADMDPAAAQPFIFFRDVSERTVPAEVCQEAEAALEDVWPIQSWRTWQDQFEAGAGTTAANRCSNLLQNVLRVTPRHPLPAGTNWHLVLKPGLPALAGRLQLRERLEVRVGDVLPFTLLEVTAQHWLYEGPSICLRFSKRLDPSLTDQLNDWIKLKPSPRELSGEVSGPVLKLRGDFQSGTLYSLSLSRKIPAEEPCSFSGSNLSEIIMPEIPSRIYFPAFSNDQLANGRRSFPMLAVNIPKVRVRAKLLPPETAIHALRGFAGYFRRGNLGDPDEMYRELDFDLVPGRTVYDQLIAATTAWDVPQTTNLDWSHLLQDRKNGVVFLDARGHQHHRHQKPIPGAQALVQLTDLGLVWKQAPDSVSLFAFSCETGNPLEGVQANLCSEENELLGRTATDTRGLAHLAAHPKARWVSLQKGEDFHAIPLQASPGGRPDFQPNESCATHDSRRLLIFSDRSLYRPGETVHLKLLARQWNETTLEIPPNLRGRLTLLDPNGQQCFETNAIFNATASCAVDLAVPATRRGQHIVKFQWGRQTYYHPFEVQDFKPDAFQIQLPAQPEYGAGEALQIPVAARYFGGDPLSRAQVKWYLSARPTDFTAGSFADFSFGKNSRGRHRVEESSGLALNGDGLLLGSSNLVLSPTLPFNPIAPRPLAASFLVEVTDLNQQTLARRVDFVRHSSEFYLGLKNPSPFLVAGEELAVEAIAVATDGQPWTNAVQANLRLQRMQWHNVRVQGAGRTVRYHHELLLSNVLEQAVELQPVPRCTESKQGRAHRLPAFHNLAAGSYLLELTAKDTAGRPVLTSTEFTVSAPVHLNWAYQNDFELKLIPDQPAYAPGQLARVLVEAPFSGMALVTVEREKVLRSYITRLEGNAPSITVPILEGDVPNVFVSVALLRGSKDSGSEFPAPEYRLGSCELAVTDDQNRLNLTITPETSDYRPGHPVEFTVQVDNHAGQAVPGAEVTLYAIDEGVLSLRNYEPPDPLAFFYEARPNRVQSGISLHRLLPENPEAFAFANKGFLGGGGSKGECAVRQNFLSCAYWNAALVTDAAGTISARFNAPDNLTSYRVFAVAHEGRRRFGSGQGRFKVSKPLVIEPALPSFAHIADQILARAVVQNRTGHAGEVIVRLELDGKAKAAEACPLAHKIFAPAQGATSVEFPVSFVDSGIAKWTWRADWAQPANPDISDAVQSLIEVRHPLPLLRQVLLQRITNAESQLLVAANPQLLAGQGTVQVTLSNTRLSELGEAAAQLLHYPYGCAEQTSSSLLPWIVLQDKADLLRLNCGTNTIEAAIAAGITRLFSMQTASGGLAYWPGASEPMLWASAYGGLVLALAQRREANLPRGDFERLLRFLSQQLRSADAQRSSLSDCCLALYALAVARRAEPAYHEKFYSLRHKLSVQDRSLLALAIAETNGPTQMIDRLVQPEGRPLQNSGAAFSSDAGTKALRLLARLAQHAKPSLLDEAVDELMNLQHNGHWNNTQADAWALLALTEYARQVEGKLLPAQGHLAWDDQRIPFNLDAQTRRFTTTFFNSNRLASKLYVRNPSGTPIFTTTTLSARPPGLSNPSLSRGFSVDRRYLGLDDFNQTQDLQALRVGDRVLVSLNVSVPQDSSYVVIDDALPSILEPINPVFQSREALPTQNSTRERSWFSNFHELRADRYLSFANSLPAGNYTLRYVARVRAAGAVTAPGTKVEEMYHPERYGVSETQTITSRPLN